MASKKNDSLASGKTRASTTPGPSRGILKQTKTRLCLTSTPRRRFPETMAQYYLQTAKTYLSPTLAPGKEDELLAKWNSTIAKTSINLEEDYLKSQIEFAALHRIKMREGKECVNLNSRVRDQFNKTSRFSIDPTDEMLNNGLTRRDYTIPFFIDIKAIAKEIKEAGWELRNTGLGVDNLPEKLKTNTVVEEDLPFLGHPFPDLGETVDKSDQILKSVANSLIKQTDEWRKKSIRTHINNFIKRAETRPLPKPKPKPPLQSPAPQKRSLEESNPPLTENIGVAKLPSVPSQKKSSKVKKKNRKQILQTRFVRIAPKITTSEQGVQTGASSLHRPGVPLNVIRQPHAHQTGTQSENQPSSSPNAMKTVRVPTTKDSAASGNSPRVTILPAVPKGYKTRIIKTEYDPDDFSPKIDQVFCLVSSSAGATAPNSSASIPAGSGIPNPNSNQPTVTTTSSMNPPDHQYNKNLGSISTQLRPATRVSLVRPPASPVPRLPAPGSGGFQINVLPPPTANNSRTGESSKSPSVLRPAAPSGQVNIKASNQYRPIKQAPPQQRSSDPNVNANKQIAEAERKNMVEKMRVAAAAGEKAKYPAIRYQAGQPLMYCPLCKFAGRKGSETAFNKHMLDTHKIFLGSKYPKQDGESEDEDEDPTSSLWYGCTSCYTVMLRLECKGHSKWCKAKGKNKNNPELRAFNQVTKPVTTGPNYTCDLCQSSQMDLPTLRYHVKSVHSHMAAKPLFLPIFRCGNCLRRFRTTKELMCHCIACKANSVSASTILELAEYLLTCRLCKSRNAHESIAETEACFEGVGIKRCGICGCSQSAMTTFRKHMKGSHAHWENGTGSEAKTAFIYNCQFCPKGEERLGWNSPNVLFHHIVTSHYNAALQSKKAAIEEGKTNTSGSSSEAQSKQKPVVIANNLNNVLSASLNVQLKPQPVTQTPIPVVVSNGMPIPSTPKGTIPEGPDGRRGSESLEEIEEVVLNGGGEMVEALSTTTTTEATASDQSSSRPEICIVDLSSILGVNRSV